MSRALGIRGTWCLFLVLGFSLHSYAAERASVNWQTDYRKAQLTRIEKRLPMLIYVTMDGCPHCHRMMNTSYRNGHVAGQISQQYVATIINGSQQEELAKQFGVRMYPTTFLVGPDNRIVDKIEGYAPAEELRRRLTIVTRYYAQLAKMKANTQR